MKKILITTHGKLCEGLLDALSMFTQNLDNVIAVGLTTDGTEHYEAEIMNAINSFGTVDILVLTDIFGGTPFQTVLKQKLEINQKLEIVYGVNFPMCLEAVLSCEACSLEELAQKCVQTGKDAIDQAVIKNNLKNEEDE